jgi:hypothetical protein
VYRRRPDWPIGLLEPAGETRGCDDIAGAPDAGAAALAMGDQHSSHRPKAIAAAEWRTSIMNVACFAAARDHDKFPCQTGRDGKS